MALISKHMTPVNIEERSRADIRPGDTVRVWQKIQEGGKTRLQAFEGIVIARKHGREPGATFTVRRMASGVGVEKIFPLYSPLIEKVEVIRRSRVRRAKLYYIREKAARQIRKKMRQLRMNMEEVIGASISEPENSNSLQGETTDSSLQKGGQEQEKEKDNAGKEDVLEKKNQENAEFAEDIEKEEKKEENNKGGTEKN